MSAFPVSPFYVKTDSAYRFYGKGPVAIPTLKPLCILIISKIYDVGCPATLSWHIII